MRCRSFTPTGFSLRSTSLLLAGASMIFLPKFDADEIIGLLPQATVHDGRADLLRAPAAASESRPRGASRHMRLFISGSAPLLAETHREWQERTGHAILERYGMTETNMNTSNPYDGERVPGTVGLPLPGCRAAHRRPDTGAALRGGRDRHDRGARPERLQGLLADAGEDRGGVPRRRLLHHRRSRQDRRATATSTSSAAART